MKSKTILQLSLVLSSCLVGGLNVAHACNPDQYCPRDVQQSAQPAYKGQAYRDDVSRVDVEPLPVVERATPRLEIQSSSMIDILQSGKVQTYRIENLATLRQFYEMRNFEPYWISRGSPNDDAEELIEMLGESWTHGLNPYSYNLAIISQLAERDGDDAAMQALDVLLSDAYIEYGQDLTGIRVDPASLKSNKRFWQKPLDAEYLIGLLNGADIDDVVASFAPRGGTYNRLRKELVTLVDERPETYEAILPIRMKGLLRPYQEHQIVRDLRVRFDVGGDSLVYDDALASKVMAFQVENGLDADGVIGPATMRAINKTRKDKIHQVIANLERLRWVPEQKPDKFVIVNVPSAMLWAVDDGRVAFDMPVIVGRKKRPTNIFTTDITGIRLNPTWTVPPTIKKEDILPKLVNDSNYLKNKGMELVHGSGSDALTLDPTAIDWTTVTEADLKRLRMVQVPGAHNPLGDYRVLMPNSYNIYLHDTNERHYFDKPGRAVSSGCIRLKRPREMANFILDNKPGWGQDDTDSVLAKGKIRDIYLPRENVIPVYLVYYTAWVDDGGEVVFGNDLYDYDAEIIKMLSNLDEIFIPMDNT